MGSSISHLTHPDKESLAALSALCLRSKGYWGYGSEFLEACRVPLTLTQDNVKGTDIGVAREDDRFIGMVQVEVSEETAELDKLFVAPSYIGIGLGRDLLNWACNLAYWQGARHMRIASDPGALRFYLAAGAVEIGTVQSEAIRSRTLPLLLLPLEAPLIPRSR